MIPLAMAFVKVRVEPQNGWLWLVALAIVVALCLFAAAGFLHYRSGNREPPAEPPAPPTV
jgi:hypothetical protein